MYASSAFLDCSFAPWNSKTDFKESAEYWISFFVIGLLTAFIPHLLYHLCSFCEHSPSYDEENPQEFKQPFPQTTVASEPKKKKDLPSTTLDLVLDDGDEDIIEEIKLPPPPPRGSRILSASKVKVLDRSGSKSTPAQLVLDRLRREQSDLHRPISKVYTLGELCMLKLASHFSQIPRVTTPVTYFDLFVNQTYPLFRKNPALKEKDLINMMQAWPRVEPEKKDGPSLPGTEELELRGAAHLVLSPSLFIHNNFTNLDFTGCQFSSIPEFAKALADQKNLRRLLLGLEHPFTFSALQKIIESCPHLQELTIAVDAFNALETCQPHLALTRLTIRIPCFSQIEQLTTLFALFPNLKSVTLWLEFSDRLPLALLLQQLKPKELRTLTTIYNEHLYTFSDEDSSREDIMIERATEPKMTLYTTRVDTEGLFGAAPSKTNFLRYSYTLLTSRYAHDPKQMRTLLKKTACTRHLNIDELLTLGYCLAYEMRLTDIKELAKLFQSKKLTNELDAASMQNLELLLRGTVECCDKNIMESVFEEKRGAFLQLLDNLS